MVEKVWTEAEIREMLQRSNRAVERGLVAIYNRQTQHEQAAEETKVLNRIGFSAFHAKRGTYYAKWVLDGKQLTGQHLEKGRKLILHYAGQLTKISNKEI